LRSSDVRMRAGGSKGSRGGHGVARMRRSSGICG
jgi:hypothetical protein